MSIMYTSPRLLDSTYEKVTITVVTLMKISTSILNYSLFSTLEKSFKKNKREAFLDLYPAMVLGMRDIIRNSNSRKP